MLSPTEHGRADTVMTVEVESTATAHSPQEGSDAAWDSLPIVSPRTFPLVTNTPT